MDYATLKQKHQKQTDDLLSEIAFFAFSEEQFSQGLKRLGIAKEEVKERIYSIGQGGFMLKSESDRFSFLVDSHAGEMSQHMEDYDFAVSAFDYELTNHEYCYTGEPWDALEALGYEPVDVLENDFLNKCFNEAKSLQMAREEF